MKVLKEVLKEISPEKKEKERLGKIAGAVIKKIKENIRKNKFKAEVEVGGSFAKGTFLKEGADIDIFVRFKEPKKNIDDALELVLKEFKCIRVHGSRDYFQLKKEGIKIEIVPVKYIKDIKEAENTTDASVLHVKWFNKKADKKIREGVRLAKQFCKANNVYGAESYIKGFSGHVLDILIVEAGSFENLLKQAVEWGKVRGKIVIDMEKHYKENPLMKLNESKKKGKLIVIDPVDKNRNAAAALSDEKLNIFIKKAREFLEKPKKEFFKIKHFNEALCRRMKSALGSETCVFLCIRGLSKNKKGEELGEDVSGTKAYKVVERIVREAGKNGFKVIKWEFRFKDKKGKAGVFFREWKIDSIEEIKGPPLNKKENVIKFKEKHSKTYEKNGRIYAKERRKFNKIEKFMENFIKSESWKERIENISFKIL